MTEKERPARPEHEGSMRSYRQGCRCWKCRAENAAYQRDYQRRRRAVLQAMDTVDKNGIPTAVIIDDTEVTIKKRHGAGGA